MLQLALAPEDDAVAIAAALAVADVKRVVVFANAAPWSRRAPASFREGNRRKGRCRGRHDGTRWEVVAVGVLADNSDATTVVGDLLGVAASQARLAALVELLGTEPVFMPRRRDDVDAIVAFVDGRQLMALKPALDFHLAADPACRPAALRAVASCSRRGVGTLGGLARLQYPLAVASRAVARRDPAALATSRGPLASLFALGVDGFRVANQLERMTHPRRIRRRQHRRADG